MQFSFGEFELDVDRLELRRAGVVVPMEPQAFDVLVYLVQQRERVVPKEELMDTVWGGRFVSETAVTSRIKQVRRALGDDGQRQEMVRTYHGRGYRFLGGETDASARERPTEVVSAPPAPAPPAPAPPGLVDREDELAQLRGDLARWRSGASTAVLVDGPAGIGKTSLLNQLRDESSGGDGSPRTVLTARGSLLEADFPFGVVRQLFDSVVEADPSLLEAAGSSALAVFGRDDGAGPSGMFPVLHGLVRLTAALAAKGPLLLLVDDVQWCDDESLRYLAFLLGRIEDLPMLLVMAQRSGESHDHAELLAAVVDAPVVRRVRPGPLTLVGTRGVVTERLGKADDAFVVACQEATGGNPLLLRQLVRALEVDGVPPDAEHAATVRATGTRAVSQLVAHRLRSLSAEQLEVATAVAVLGDASDLVQVAALAGLDERVTARAVDELARAELFRPELPPGFIHPLVGAAVHDDLGAAQREVRHRDAARVLTELGAPAEQVAAHLLVVPGRGDETAADVLAAAAHDAARRGAPATAVTLLRRALAEPPRDDRVAGLLAEVGELEVMAGQMTEALADLEEAYRRTSEPERRATTGILLARTALFAAPRGVAERLATAAAAELPDELDDQRQELIALARNAAYPQGFDPTEHLGPRRPWSGEGPGARGLAAVTAWELAVEGADRAAALEAGRFSLEGRILQDHDPGLLWALGAMACFLAGEDTRHFWEDELDRAYDAGNLFGSLTAQLWLGFVTWHRGDLRAALQLTASALGTQALTPQGLAYVQSLRLHVLLDQGDLAAARIATEESRPVQEQVLEASGPGDFWRLFSEAEARLLFGEWRTEEALEVLDRVESVMPFVVNPGLRSWRRLRARALHDVGRTDEALALAAEELEVAEGWGTNGFIGRALLLRGQIEADGADTLRKAVARLEFSERRLDLTLARWRLAEAIGVGSEEGRGLLVKAYEESRACAADGLSQTLATSLTELGVDVDRLAAPPVSLSLLERRLARLAASGVPVEEAALRHFLPTRVAAAMLDDVVARLGVGAGPSLVRALDTMDAGLLWRAEGVLDASG